MHHCGAFKYFHTVCSCTISDGMLTFFNLSDKLPNHKAAYYANAIISLKHTVRERERESSNSKTLFDKDCNLASVKNLSNNRVSE